ncbi:MFS transporter [Actinomycetes bacterium KLBMP 9759]
MSSYRTVLRNAEFRAVLVAHVFAMLAIIVADVALTVLVYQRTNSPMLAAMTFAIGFVPMGLGAVLLGGAGRTRPSRDVLVTCEIAVALLVAIMALPGMPVPAILGLLAVKGFIDPVFAGTRTATLSELVGDDGFPLARSLLRLVAQNAQFAGFAAGGLALVFVPPTQALIGAAAGHAAAALILLIGTRRRPSTERGARRSTPAAAVRALLSVPGVGPVLVMSWLPGFFLVAPEGLAVTYAHDLGGGSLAVGLLLTGLPAGAVLGELIVGSRMSPASRERLVVPFAASAFVPVLGFAFSPPLPVAIALLVLGGLGMSYSIGLDQITIARIPEQVRRQSFTLVNAGMMVTQGLGFAAAGAVAEWLPVPVALPLLATTGLAAVLLAGRGLHRAARVGHMAPCR